MDSARIDRWLWAVRLYKTRTAATDACRGGHVRLNGAPAKPSSTVRVGDRITARIDRERIVEVVQVIEARVGASAAAECLIDHSPPVPDRTQVAPVFARDPAAGRPTKRERRQLDRFRNR